MRNQTCSLGKKWLALPLGLVLLAGCVIIPMNSHDPGSRRNVSERTQGELQTGITSKEDVLLRLGEPDFVSENGQRIGYAWTKTKALILMVMEGGSDLTRSNILEVSFDTSNRVSHVQVLKIWNLIGHP